MQRLLIALCVVLGLALLALGAVLFRTSRQLVERSATVDTITRENETLTQQLTTAAQQRQRLERKLAARHPRGRLQLGFSYFPVETIVQYQLLSKKGKSWIEKY